MIRTINNPARYPRTVLCLSVAVAIFAIFSSGSIVHSQQPQETFFESAIGTANQSIAAPLNSNQGPVGEAITLTSGLEPELDRNFVWSGLISSNSDGLPTTEEEEDDPQSAVILPLRDDGGLYLGTLTYQTNSPVDVTVWNVLNLNDSATASEEFGETGGTGIVEGHTVAPIEIASGTSGSVPFIGNVLELVGDDDDPFLVTYAIDAIAGKPTFIGNSTLDEQSVISE